MGRQFSSTRIWINFRITTHTRKSCKFRCRTIPLALRQWAHSEWWSYGLRDAHSPLAKSWFRKKWVNGCSIGRHVWPQILEQKCSDWRTNCYHWHVLWQSFCGHEYIPYIGAILHHLRWFTAGTRHITQMGLYWLSHYSPMRYQGLLECSTYCVAY